MLSKKLLNKTHIFISFTNNSVTYKNNSIIYKHLTLSGFLAFYQIGWKFWQRDAVHILQKLLTNEEVEIHVQVTLFIHRCGAMLTFFLLSF